LLDILEVSHHVQEGSRETYYDKSLF